MSALLPPPIIYVADYTAPIPEDIIRQFLTPEVSEHAGLLPKDEAQAFLWSRLILQSVTQQFQPSLGRTLTVVEDFTSYLKLEGGFYNFCSIDIRGKFVGLALSILPINICLTLIKESGFWEELETVRFPPLFLNWIERQPDPRLAFSQLWAAKICLFKRNDPTIRLTISPEDTLMVEGSCASIHESLSFWRAKNWLAAVQGPALNSVLTEIRTPEKTIGLLKGTYVEPSIEQ